MAAKVGCDLHRSVSVAPRLFKRGNTARSLDHRGIALPWHSRRELFYLGVDGAVGTPGRTGAVGGWAGFAGIGGWAGNGFAGTAPVAVISGGELGTPFVQGGGPLSVPGTLLVIGGIRFVNGGSRFVNGGS